MIQMFEGTFVYMYMHMPAVPGHPSHSQRSMLSRITAHASRGFFSLLVVRGLSPRGKLVRESSRRGASLRWSVNRQSRGQLSSQRT